ncbi:MAG: GNAT family N-acetyltransferase [Oscillospiraceae bacterium]|nr:GNAT family N-acetyltransferase [Oscillospiraceae bacterium]
MNIEQTKVEQQDSLRELWQEAFGDPDGFPELFFETGWSQQRSRCAVVEGKLAAALYWFDCGLEGEKIAYIYAVATGEQFRRQGICRALMEDTHRLLKRMGYAGAVLVSAEGLFGMYEAMGYRVCSRILEFTCSAGKVPAELTPLTKEKYALQRRKLLPQGAVLQEGKNLDFLEGFARFYGGEGFLLAGAAEDGVFYGAELLGDVAAAPGVLKSLGCTVGHFRGPGEGRDFAMYLPLRENAPVPKYFGLAFD